jgi:hypothetical protein
MPPRDEALGELARRLFVVSSHDPEHPQARSPVDAMQTLCGRLETRLGSVLGARGVRALLARALHLAGMEVEWLARIRVEATCCKLEGLERAAVELDGESLREGLIEVVAGVLELLARFLGKDLTLRLVQDGWPELGAVTPGSDAGGGDGE